MQKSTKIFTKVLLLIVLLLVVVYFQIDIGEYIDLPTDDEVTTEQTQTEAEVMNAEVTRVVDGDTIEVKVLPTGPDAHLADAWMENVRLIGIDSPEIDWEEMAAECFGFEAREYLSDLLQGENVRLETDPSQPKYDAYDRLLAYVFLGDENINQRLLEDGYAQELTVGPGYEKRAEFLNKEAVAQAGDYGLWAVCDQE